MRIEEPEEEFIGLSYVNSRAFSYAVLGLAIGYFVSFVIGASYNGNGLLIYFIIGLFKLPVIFVQQLYLDVALVFIPISIAGLYGKLRSNRTIFMFALLTLSIWASSRKSYSVYTSRSKAPTTILATKDEFGLPVSHGHKFASYLDFVTRSARYSLDHGPAYAVDHYSTSELGHFQPQNNLRFIIVLIVGISVLTSALVRRSRKPPERHWSHRSD